MRPPPLRLLGTDVLLLAMGRDHPNNALFVIECDGAVSPDGLAQAVSRLLPTVPWLDARLRRGRPWGYLRWQLGAHPAPPPIENRALGPEETLPDVLQSILNRRIDPRREPPLRLTVVAGPGSTSALVVAWSHPLMDPRGVELLMAMLTSPLRPGVITPTRDARPLRDRLTQARTGLTHLHAATTPPCRSPARGVRSLGQVRFRHASLPASDTPASTRTMPVRLAVVGRAMTRLWEQRGLPLDDPFLVPISVDRRRKGEPGPVFCNNVAFHFARFTPASTADPAAAAAEIRRGMTDAVRHGAIEALATGTDLFCWQPAGRLLAPFRGGDLASFNCADTGAVRPVLTDVFGGQVRNAYHVPCVAPSPGLGVFINRCGAHENVVLVWIDGVLQDADVTQLLTDVIAGLRTP